MARRTLKTDFERESRFAVTTFGMSRRPQGGTVFFSW